MVETDTENQVKGLSRLTVNAKRVIGIGYQTAVDFKYSEYQIIHLFYVLLQINNGIVLEIFNKLGIDIDSTINRIKEEFGKNKDQNKDFKDETVFSKQFKDLIHESFVVALDLSHVYVGTEHLLLAMFKLEGVNFIEELKGIGINFETLKKTLLSIGNYGILNASLRGDPTLDAQEFRQ